MPAPPSVLATSTTTMNVSSVSRRPARTPTTRVPRKTALKNVCFLCIRPWGSCSRQKSIRADQTCLSSSFPPSTLCNTVCRRQAVPAAQVADFQSRNLPSTGARLPFALQDVATTTNSNSSVTWERDLAMIWGLLYQITNQPTNRQWTKATHPLSRYTFDSN